MKLVDANLWQRYWSNDGYGDLSGRWLRRSERINAGASSHSVTLVALVLSRSPEVRCLCAAMKLIPYIPLL